jgi:glycosyltransferase involved in cell wall biosynthesis
VTESAGASVLMCVRNGERYLRGAVESALAQTRPPHEIVLVDDGSTDGTAELARSFDGALRVIQQEQLGLGVARNRALAAATGEFAGYLDADDLWEPCKLEVQLAAFERDPSLDMVYGHIRRFADESPDQLSEAVAAPYGGTLLFRLSAAERIGPFPTDVRVGEFLDWTLRARDLGLREAMVPEVVTLRREHAANITRREAAPFGDFARLLKASIDRRRAS